MRWTAFIALAICFSGATAPAQTSTDPTTPAQSPPKKTKPGHVQLPAPTAEPENQQAYGPVIPPEPQGPTPAEIGPVQKHFALASETDDLASTQVNDNASQALHEKVALDKRIKVPLIHDVENNGADQYRGNHALEYELTYLNWGAITSRQLQARRGHYFTITWANDGPKSDFTTRFEYRQVKSQEIVRTLTQTVPQVSGATRSYFAVVNHAYLAYGPVCSWRFTVLKGDTVVAESKSFIW